MKTLIFACLMAVGLSAKADLPNPEAMKANAQSAVTNSANDANAAMNTNADNAKSKVETLKKAAHEANQKALVNLNTASADDLAKLPGIGKTRAEAIVANRPYNDVTDLKKVKGIKEGVISKIKNLVTVK